MADDSAAAIAALADWKNDGFELEDAVDQAAFKEEFGFEYESQRFDSVYESLWMRVSGRAISPLKFDP